MKVNFLSPTMEDLCADHVLVQAWKKTTKYIRDYNWYADTLALDLSAVQMPKFTKEIQDELQSGMSWSSDPIQIVPAPKSQEWIVSSGKWAPKHSSNVIESIRPLAHVSLRDQVVATAAMLCLANKVESRQGSSTLDCKEAANRKRVINYGNRLFCDADVSVGGSLCHRWGSSKLYRSYFQDYRSFINRPEAVATAYKSDGCRVAVVQADISKFYDRVRPAFLHNKLAKFCEHESEKPFHCFLTKLLDWRWREGFDEKYARKYGKLAGIVEFNQVAIPQGLVAGGFFANIALLDFDDAMRSCLNKSIGDGLVLVDVCRYVDDIRLVITVESGKNAEDVKCASEKWLANLFEINAPDLIINGNKTLVAFVGESERTLIPQSLRMERIQRSVSGGFDAAGGMDVLAEIESLFRGQDQYGDDNRESRIAWPFMIVPDVRDETVVRFGANRFRTTFRSLRPLLEDESPDLPGTCLEGKNSSFELIFSKQQLDSQARAFSYGLIERWLRDPSHIRILRIALDIYPDSNLLEYLFGLMWQYIGPKGRRKEPRDVVLYCFSEIFRAGATETGFVEDVESLPVGINILSYREVMHVNALKLIGYAHEHPQSLPWYFLQQVMLFEVMNKSNSETLGCLPNGKQLSHYKDFLTLLAGRKAGGTTLFEIYSIMALRTFGGAQWVVDLVIQGATPNMIDRLARIDSGCAEFLLKQAPELLQSTSSLTLLMLGLKSGTTFGFTPGGKVLTLGQASRSQENPIRLEPELLNLAIKWLEHYANTPSTGFFPDVFSIKLDPPTFSTGYHSVASLVIDPSCDSERFSVDLPRYALDAGSWRWALGNILLFAVRGSISPIPLVAKADKSDIRYRAVPSEWVARFFGGYFGRERMGDPSLPISTWMEDFLFSLLAWPGCPMNADIIGNLPANASISETLQVCRARVEELKLNRGISTGLIFLHKKVERATVLDDQCIRICVAQNVRPIYGHNGCPSDFDPNDPEFNGPNIRREMRRHLRSILSGISKMLIVRDTHLDRGHRLDWLIMPELSVHPADIRPILVPFVRRHKCLVFAGLTYHSIAAANLLVNEALWLIPSTSHSGAFSLNTIYQGKQNLAPDEVCTYNSSVKQIQGYRPCQWVLDYHWSGASSAPLKLTGSICYDATDLSLVSDLRDRSDIYAISAFNKDIGTFDSMTQALHYHMYQMVILANNGTFGGSNAYLPYKEHPRKHVFHVHGQPQAMISFMEIDDPKELIDRGCDHVNGHGQQIWKYPPAGRKR